MIPGVLFATDENLELDGDRFRVGPAASEVTGSALGHVLRVSWVRRATGTPSVTLRGSQGDLRARLLLAVLAGAPLIRVRDGKLASVLGVEVERVEELMTELDEAGVLHRIDGTRLTFGERVAELLELEAAAS